MTCESSARIKHGQCGRSTAGRRGTGQRNRCVLEVALLSMIESILLDRKSRKRQTNTGNTHL